jgi:hypothetical protein
MQGSGVNTNSGTGSNAMGSRGPRALAGPGQAVAVGRLETRGADLRSILKIGPLCRQSNGGSCEILEKQLVGYPRHIDRTWSRLRS